MNGWDALRLAADNLRKHPLRSALTMLGMVFGVGAVIAMLAIGAGAQRRALRMIEHLGLHTVQVRDVSLGEKELQEVRRDSVGVSPRDAEAILASVPDAQLAVPRVEIKPYLVLGAGRTTEASVEGVSWRQRRTAGLEVVAGRYLDALDERSHAAVCAIGDGVRRRLFGYRPAVGRLLKVNDLWLRVVGVLGHSGGGGNIQGVAIGAPDDEIHIPYTTALAKLDRPPLAAPLSAITIQFADGADTERAGRLTRRLLERLHGTTRDFEVVVPQALLEQSRRTQRLFNLVMGLIAGISLLVGGIGIMNIMLATVLERTREIGVRRAVGATREDITRLFLIESFTISVLGGGAGIVLGVAIAWLVAASAGWPTVVTPLSIALAAGVAMTVGILSGLYPARRAADLDPIDALRWE